jgi:arsenite methyltransferase
MAELTTTETDTVSTVSSCCAPEQQTDCCEAGAKTECCEPSHGEGCGCAAGDTIGSSVTDIREQVRERYAAAALQVVSADAGAGCCAPSDTFDCASEVFGAALYAIGDREQIPDTAVLASLGCGNPTAVADLHEGETVLDLGSGGGIDVLLSARRVGPTGLAYGLDMTDEMLALAQENQVKAGVQNVRWLRGHIEEIPLPAESVDVVISNCVINLSGDKAQVLREVARVLRPGGRFAVSDVIADPDMDAATRQDMQAYTGCIAGALTRTEFEQVIAGAGLINLEIRETHRVHQYAGSAIIRASKPAVSMLREREVTRLQLTTI